MLKTTIITRVFNVNLLLSSVIYGVFLNQVKYVLNILQLARLEESKPPFALMMIQAYAIPCNITTSKFGHSIYANIFRSSNVYCGTSKVRSYPILSRVYKKFYENTSEDAIFIHGYIIQLIKTRKII